MKKLNDLLTFVKIDKTSFEGKRTGCFFMVSGCEKVSIGCLVFSLAFTGSKEACPQGCSGSLSVPAVRRGKDKSFSLFWLINSRLQTFVEIVLQNYLEKCELHDILSAGEMYSPDLKCTSGVKSDEWEAKLYCFHLLQILYRVPLGDLP